MYGAMCSGYRAAQFEMTMLTYHIYLFPLSPKDIDIKKVNGAPQYAFLQYCDIASVCKAIKKMDGEYLGNNRLKVRTIVNLILTNKFNLFAIILSNLNLIFIPPSSVGLWKEYAYNMCLVGWIGIKHN